MSTTKTKLISKFYGGITRDDKAKIVGVASNVEEIDIFSNQDWIQAEQIFTSDTLPATTEVYAYTASPSGASYTYGKETSGNKVRICARTGSGSATPASLSTFFTSADATNLAYTVSPLQSFTLASGVEKLYYTTNASGTIVLKSLTTSGLTEATVGTLTGLSNNFDRIAMRVIFGELFITNGKYIAKIDNAGTFTEKAFTLPDGWTAVDLAPVSDVSVILARPIAITENYAKGFWWDLTSSVQFDDSFDLPAGGPQWVVNHKETIKICCALNGKARFFQMSGAFAGAVPIEIPGMVLDNVQNDSTSVPASPAKGIAVKDKILYFILNKTDKTGVYALGQLDSDKPTALILSKRFATTDYSLHVPYALMIHGPNYYGAYSDNGTMTSVICASSNSPSRSSSGVYETIWIDDENPMANKVLENVFITTYPLPASTDVNVFNAGDYGSYSEITRADGTSLNTTSAVLGMFGGTLAKVKVIKLKTQLVSSGANSPKLTAIGLVLTSDGNPANF